MLYRIVVKRKDKVIHKIILTLALHSSERIKWGGIVVEVNMATGDKIRQENITRIIAAVEEVVMARAVVVVVGGSNKC